LTLRTSLYAAVVADAASCRIGHDEQERLPMHDRLCEAALGIT